MDALKECLYNSIIQFCYQRYHFWIIALFVKALKSDFITLLSNFAIKDSIFG
ncbi:TPA_asm: hypothetical protein [Altiarchaeum virus]|nr:TPA_asm: hypothetical protein [Altiarchaeum virus]